ncbi:MAG: hypothetical protein RLZZ68_697 [Bacteroidota bacterium]|jgi:hypothetical protein|nr:hypothetical protein [Flavobacteriia bacterium]
MNIHDLIPKVEGVFLALLEEKDNAEYAVYLVNDRKDIMEGIIVTSVGFGENLQSGEALKTATLRHSLEVLLPEEYAKIELIVPEVFGLYNEYWVSFWVDEVLYDKKFLFLPDSIKIEDFTVLPKFNKRGIFLT